MAGDVEMIARQQQDADRTQNKYIAKGEDIKKQGIDKTSGRKIQEAVDT